MRNVAFVTCHKLPQLTDDDRLAAAELERRGVRVLPAIWNEPNDWRAFDAIVLRSCWDYHLHAAEFRSWLDARRQESARLWNPPALVQWNVDKTYLRDLQQRGVRVVPTEWLAPGEPAQLGSVMKARGWPQAVLKPAISATAHRTALVEAARATDAQPLLDEILRDGAALVQEYFPVHETGEWSLMFFGGRFSHAVQKFAKPGDFRVQNDFGGTHISTQPPASLLAEAQRSLDAAAGPTLYARVDGIVLNEHFYLMELELIEPALYLADEPAAPACFADAIAATL